MSSRWKCRECGSHSVQISLPAWYYESTNYELEFIQTDEEAEPMYWYCDDCQEGGRGLPEEVDPAEQAQQGLFDWMLTWPGEEGRQ